jgi:hypothetical protein
VIPIASGVRVWIATGHTDMRRGMNSADGVVTITPAQLGYLLEEWESQSAR